MTHSIFLSVLLSIAAGLSTIACTKPTVFSSMVWPLLALCNVLLALVFSWHMGADSVQRALQPFIAPQHTEAAALAIRASMPSSDIYIGIGTMLLLVPALGWLAAKIRATDGNNAHTK